MHLVSASLPAKGWGDIRVLGKPIFKQMRPGYCSLFPNTRALHAARNLIKDFKLRCLILCQVLPRKKTTISGIQRKGLAIKWFAKGSCQKDSRGEVLDSPGLM